MIEIVINCCYGGYSLSCDALKWLESHGVDNIGDTDDPFFDDRANPMLVEVVKELGSRASGMSARLKVVSIPDGVNWVINNYDGMEHIAEVHRIWY